MEPREDESAERRHAYYMAKATEADQRAAKCVLISDRMSWEEQASSWRAMAAQTAKIFKL